MKKILYALIWVYTALPLYVSAWFFPEPGVAQTIPVIGRVDNATQSWSGSLITNFDTDVDRTPISTIKSSEMYFDNATQSFSWFFVLTAACATVDCKKVDGSNNWDESAFVAFLNDASRAYLVQSGSTEIYKMKWFAWSKSSWWISFDTGRSDTVTYNRNKSEFSGFAWSKNLGYISMNGLRMVSQIPKLDLPNVLSANHAQTANLVSFSWSVVSDGWFDVYKLTIEDWKTTPDGNVNAWWVLDSTWTTGSFSTIDIRYANSSSWEVSYGYKLQDPFGNTSSGVLSVVANIPSDTLDVNNIWSSYPSDVHSWSVFTLSWSNLRANALDGYEFSPNFHDKYGNPIVSVDQIKHVFYSVQIDNNVSPNQSKISSAGGLISSQPSLGDAIIFDWTMVGEIPVTNFSKLTDQKDTGTGVYISKFKKTSSTAKKLIIKSYIPTNSEAPLWFGNWLSFSWSYDIQSLTWGVSNASGSIAQTGLGFSPGWKVGNVQLISTNTDAKFWLNLPVTTSTSWDKENNFSFTNPKTLHLYGTDSDSELIIFTWSDYLTTYEESISDWDAFNKWNSWSFAITPQLVVTGSLTSLDFQLEHQIIHVFDTLDGSFAYYVWWAVGTWVTQNRGIKIIGTASTSNSGSIFALNTQDEYTKVGNFSKPQVKDFVRQNVEAIIRNKPSDVLVKTSADYQYALSDMTGIRTLIIKDHDLLINSDVGTPWSAPMAIIVLNGNIKIWPDAKNIYASIFTDKWLYAVKTDGSLIDDSSRSNNQLYIFGTLISGNTVGTSAQSASEICPDFLGKNNCTPEQKKQYDLNFLRTGPNSHSAWIGSRTDLQVYPVVIEYNPKLTSDPPPGFKKMTR